MDKITNMSATSPSSSPDVLTALGLIAAIVLPFSNIPLMMTLERRKSSKDISLTWTIWVWVCLVAMLPSGIQSADPVFRVFTSINLVLFTGVLVQVVRYR